MEEEAVEPQETTVMDEMIEDHQESESDHSETIADPKMVPLTALQKERRKRQEAEQELEWERKRKKETPEEDLSSYESATKEDLSTSQLKTIQMIEERQWIRSNPERYEKVMENLSSFLKQKPHLAVAIDSAPNRYEEAYTLMEALTPKEKQQVKHIQQPKREAPRAPTSVPKGAMLNEAIDLMSMSDQEFNAWRKSQRRKK